jgi:hypothetical protein
MSSLTVSALVLVGFLLLLVALRLLGRGALQSLDDTTMAARLRNEGSYRGLRTPLDDTYQEVLRIADLQLESGETVLAACGVRGEIETVLMATTRRLLLLTRRPGGGKYHAETFDYRLTRPIPVSQSVIGGNIRLLEGQRIAEMKSPGAESWMDSAEDTIRIINRQISAARASKD